MIKIHFNLRPGWQPVLTKSSENGGIMPIDGKPGHFRVNLTAPDIQALATFHEDAKIEIEIDTDHAWVDP